MKTVKDFKDAGGVLTVGDKLKPSPSPDWHPRDDDTLESFAWRTNTGVKPEFSGVIELEFKDGSVELNRATWQFVWCLNREIPRHEISRWRPHLSKVEDKPKSPYDVDAHVSGEDFTSTLKRPFAPTKGANDTAKSVNATTALYAFAGWLTSMDKPITFSSGHWAAPAADMVAEMIRVNNINEECDFDSITVPNDFKFPLSKGQDESEPAKQVFTQAIQEVGDILMYTLNESGGAPWYKCEILDIGVAGYTIRSPHLEENYDIGVQFIKRGGIVFKPIQTEYEKAIEYMMFHGCQSITVKQAKELYDAGYRLQTPKNNVT